MVTVLRTSAAVSAAELLDRDEERVRRVGRATAGRENDIDPLTTGRERSQGEDHRWRVVGGVQDPLDPRAQAVDLRPDAPLAALSIRRPPGLLHQDAPPPP